VQHDETSLLLTSDKQRWQAEIGSRVARSGDLGRCGDRVRMGCWWLCIRFVHKIASALDRAVWCPLTGYASNKIVVVHAVVASSSHCEQVVSHRSIAARRKQSDLSSLVRTTAGPVRR
jgi:hypothetical protein